ncbi:MAG: hypothetical protein ACRDIV_21310 [Ktedonobacteraceae bacterium]
MAEPTRKLYPLMLLVFCAIVFTAFIAVIFNFMRTFTPPPSYPSSWMIVMIAIIFTCILVLFTSFLYILVLMLGFAELRAQLLDLKQKSEQAQPTRSGLHARVSPGATPIRRRQSRFTLPDA